MTDGVVRVVSTERVDCSSPSFNEFSCTSASGGSPTSVTSSAAVALGSAMLLLEQPIAALERLAEGALTQFQRASPRAATRSSSSSDDQAKPPNRLHAEDL